jgi:hypothetical protein
MRSLLALALAAAAAAQQRQSLAGEWQIQAQAEGAPVLSVRVPAAFETALGTAFDGVATYRRALPLPERFTGRVRLEFAAVATQATVRCNGTEVGRHLGGWTPFRVDVTDQLRWDGSDAIEVVVDEKVGHNTQGFLPIIEPHFGGIWQDVTLCLDRAPVLDRLSLFAFGRGNGELAYDFAALPALAEVPSLRATIEVLDGGRVLASQQRDVRCGERIAGIVPTPQVRAWSPAQPQLYTLRLRLLAPDRECDVVERRIGFRSLAADGTRVRWNGEPLQVRGLLHWGYSPPDLAPPSDPARWRPQLIAMRERGFNLLKCCLWVPPPCVYELADELGLLVWQEYPTWHPQMDAAHEQQLLAEYAEFFAADRNHPAVAFRSITCETGHGADFDVVKALWLACKEAVPETLVVDDSSWIGWQRVSDFWDEHPYGNNSWFPGRLGDFARYIAEHGKKPLLLGECIAADTWIDSAAWREAHGAEECWWRPDCWVAQQAAETWLAREFGDAALRAVLPSSLDFALRNRKFQIEQLRMALPDAGYVVSVARDFGKARMGLVDDLDRAKWPASAWSWHGDTMLCLDLPWHGRALGAASAAPAVRVAHSGRGPLRGELRLWTDDVDARPQQVAVEVNPGEVSAPIPVAMPQSGAQSDTTPRRVRVYARLAGSHAASNEWDLWLVPPPSLAGNDVVHADALTPELLDRLERGACVMLHAGDRPGSLRTEAMWSLRGAPFAPPHPVHERVPAELLLELASFDLESGRVLPWGELRDQIDPILAFWETHDIPQVRFHLLAGACRVGKGRLLVTTLRLDGPTNPAGAFVQQAFAEHLLRGPAPKRELSSATIAALRGQLTEKRIELPTWRFRTDPEDAGRAANWQDPKTDASVAPWRDLRAGAHWENQAEDLKNYDGVAWYRVDVAVPADWQGSDARAVFEGVDDSFEAWLNGEPIGRFGDPATKTTVWLERQVAEIGQRLRAGATNTLVLRVVDQGGAGGLWKPVFLTTGPAARTEPLLH